jgi:RNA-directed DNA polymerase
MAKEPDTKVCPRPTGLLLQKNLENCSNEEKQMTVMVKPLAGASSAASWDTTPWQTVHKQVKQLQMRIAKAVREKRYGKVKALQWLLTHSHYGKFLTVKRVTQSVGAKTPGLALMV